MDEKIAAQLQTILDRLDGVEIKLAKLEGIFERFANLETAVNKNQTELNSLNVKTKAIQKSVGEIEEGMEFANFQIEELKKKDEENADKNKKLEDQLLYQEVYSRRENMRFFGIPEATQGHEDTGEVIHKFIRDELNIDDPESIEFQRAHRLGKRINGQSRPIIVRFLKFPERKLVFRCVQELGEDTDVKVYADFPKEIRERRSKPEPDKLYIDGELVPL